MDRLPSPVRHFTRPLAPLLLLLIAASLSLATRAAEPPDADVFAQQLAAGEFAPALASIQISLPVQERDERFVAVAEAQAKSGARDDALHTLAYVRDDRARTSAIQSVRQSSESATGRGGAQADFDTLIDLITNTVRPPSWDAVGGPGTISEFRNGVYVDADGTLRRVIEPEKAEGLAVARLTALIASDESDPRRFAPLRKVSLSRLEKHVQLRLAAGRPLDDDMLHLAGLEKIKFVFVYPETGDLVLAGPAGPWRIDAEGRPVSQKTGRPVIQLDDLVVMLRFAEVSTGSDFGCSINPTTEGLARTRDFAERSSASPLKPGQRPAWLQKLRDQMGPQSISVDGIDPCTRAARVLVEADYRMKLVGMGLEKGTLDVPSYLELVSQTRGAAPLEVLRWWFTLKYDSVLASADRDAFEIRGQAVQVLSENELLTQLGKRVHTGKSDPVNQEFARRFTDHFGAISQKYPVYADLANIFDLALVAALIQSEKLADRVAWHMTCFSEPDSYPIALGAAPRQVDTVINHHLMGGHRIIVGVSGGVHVEPWSMVKSGAIESDRYGSLAPKRANSAAAELPIEAWWWD